MKIIFLYILGGAALLGLLGVLYYALSPLFIQIRVDEALPGLEAKESSMEEVSSTSSDMMPIEQYRIATVVDTPAHPASGAVRVIESEGKTYIRYEDYKTINGPDLFVYLAKDLNAEEFVDLGRIRATEGNINYEVPPGVDLSEYRYVLTWCKAFGVLFNYADISEIP